MVLVPIIKIAVLKVGTVFVQDNKVRVILKIEPYKQDVDTFVNHYYVSRPVDFELFPKDKVGFISEMQKHPELKQIQYLYSCIEDFYWLGFHKSRRTNAMNYAERVTFTT